MKQIIFTESTSLGIRTYPFRKDTLSREFETISTPLGQVKIKRSFFRGKEVSAKPEYDDCKLLAAEKGIPVKDVYNQVMAILTERKSNQ